MARNEIFVKPFICNYTISTQSSMYDHLFQFNLSKVTGMIKYDNVQKNMYDNVKEQDAAGLQKGMKTVDLNETHPNQEIFCNN